MNETIILRGEPQKARLWALLKNWQAMLAQGKPLAVSVKTHKAKRSLDQNKRYFAILRQLSETAWVDGKTFHADTWHEFMKDLLATKIEGPHGVLYPMSTSQMDVAEFSQYMMRVEEYAAREFGVVLGIDFDE